MRKLLRWLLTIMFTISGVLPLWMALFNAWVSSGPPTRYPEIYQHRAQLFLTLSIVFFMLSGLSL